MSLLVLPFANVVGQALRTDLCRGDGACGYEPPRTRCDTLSRDIGLAAALTVRERSVDTGRGSEVTTTADGVTVVGLSPDDDTAAVVTGRLGATADSESGSSAQPGNILAQRFRFAGPDEARAWLEHRRRRYRPLHAAAVGGGDGSVDVAVGAVLGALGFEGAGTDRPPDEVDLETSRQLTAGSYLVASGPAAPGAPTAALRLGVALGAKVDLAAIAKELKAKGYAEGSVSGTGGYQTIYTFPSHEAAEAWVDRNRGVLDHITNAVGGVTTDAVDQGLNWIKRKTGWGNQDDARSPDAVVVDLGAQARVGGGYGMSTLAGAAADGKGAVNGSLRVDGDGTKRFTGSFDVEGNANGALAFVSGKLGFTGKAQYVVSYDKNGKPTRLLRAAGLSHGAVPDGCR